MTPEMIAEYEVLLLGTSTWGVGELQEDWYAGIDTLKKANLKVRLLPSSVVGILSHSPQHFCSAMAEIYNAVRIGVILS